MGTPTTLTYPSNLPSKYQVPIVDLRSVLPVNPRYTWETLHPLRSINKLSTLVFHHDALSKLSTKPYDDQTLAVRIAQSHINTTKNISGGDAGFPYHAWLRNGTIYIANNIEALTFGVASNNDYTVHICVSGEYSVTDQLTDQDRTALYAAYFLFKQWLPSFQKLVGHKELMPTACPGYSMDTVRSDITSIEEQMDYNASPSAERVTAYAFAERIDDLGKRLIDPKWGPEARRKVMLLAPAIKDTAGDASTAETIVARVMDLYKKALNGNFADEATRKLLICANAGKECGLI